MALKKENYYYRVDGITYKSYSATIHFVIYRYKNEAEREKGLDYFTCGTPTQWLLAAPSKSGGKGREFDDIFGAKKLSEKSLIQIIYEQLKIRDDFFANAENC